MERCARKKCARVGSLYQPNTWHGSSDSRGRHTTGGVRSGTERTDQIGVDRADQTLATSCPSHMTQEQWRGHGRGHGSRAVLVQRPQLRILQQMSARSVTVPPNPSPIRRRLFPGGRRAAPLVKHTPWPPGPGSGSRTPVNPPRRTPSLPRPAGRAKPSQAQAASGLVYRQNVSQPDQPSRGARRRRRKVAVQTAARPGID